MHHCASRLILSIDQHRKSMQLKLFFLATSFYNRSLWNCVCDLLTEICFNWDIFRVEQGKNQEGEGRKEKDCCAACNKTVIATKMCPWKKVVKLYTPRPSPVNCQPMVLNRNGQNDIKIKYILHIKISTSDF